MLVLGFEMRSSVYSHPFAVHLPHALTRPTSRGRYVARRNHFHPQASFIHFVIRNFLFDISPLVRPSLLAQLHHLSSLRVSLVATLPPTLPGQFDGASGTSGKIAGVQRRSWMM
jgi:hypothetical protein